MKAVVIGAGAAGLMAAGRAAELGVKVVVIEKNDRPGKKMLITGKGRCNITNVEPMPEFIRYIPGNGQFLYSSLSRFNNMDMIGFLEGLGLQTKVERGGRVFPVSDKAADVVDTLVNYCKSKEVEFLFSAKVLKVRTTEGKVTGVILDDGKEINCDSVILATGGSSYPGTGSTGDGYRMAAELGHTITPLKPALVPLETEEEWVKELQGLSLKNVEANAFIGERKIASDFGEMLFTHFGISGPIVLTMSRTIVPQLENGGKVLFKINLKPALTVEQLDARIQRDFAKYNRKQYINSLHDLLPKSLIPVIARRSGIPETKPVHQITREERLTLIDILRNFTVTVNRPRPLREAIVTAGGVSVREINPKTMESKLVNGLYFAGEVVDVDAYTGGFNLQAAFSMGYAAAEAAASQW